jgi:hypothetical protein
MARLGWVLGAVTVLALAVTATGFGVKVEPHEETCFHDDLKVRTQQRYTHTHTHTHTLSLLFRLCHATHITLLLWPTVKAVLFAAAAARTHVGVTT